MKKHLLIYFIVFCTSLINSVRAQTWKELTTSSSDLKTVYGGISSICSDSSGNVYAIGTFRNANNYTYVAKWNGTSWSELGDLGNGYNVINAICTDKDGNVYAGGEFENADNYNYVAKWDGTSWSEVGGLDALKANVSINILVSDDAGNIYATGSFTDSYGQHYVAKWDGTSWTEVGGLQGLVPDAELSAMAVDKDLNLYVGGNKQSTVAPYVESIYKWDGAVWSEIGTSSSSAVFKADMQVTSIGVTPTGNIYVATNNKNSDGKYIIAKWDGATWTAIPVNITDANTTPIVHVDYYGQIYVSGYESPTGQFGALQFNIYKWNGTAFVQLGNLNGSSVVVAMYSDKKGNLFAGGLFNDATTNIPFVAEYTAASGTMPTAITAATYTNGTIKIYPNPAQDVVTVDVTSDLIGTAYYIYDARGILQASGILAVGSSRLSIENLSTGLYFIQLGDLSNNAFKLVKK
ncbi:MAG TPA: T9SS type A sorting domain-containing protein [Cytophaga sp.]|nr:T9SS type A sorting domain-containing protein [Cytophaga sp.]